MTDTHVNDEIASGLATSAGADAKQFVQEIRDEAASITDCEECCMFLQTTALAHAGAVILSEAFAILLVYEAGKGSTDRATAFIAGIINDIISCSLKNAQRGAVAAAAKDWLDALTAKTTERRQ